VKPILQRQNKLSKSHIPPFSAQGPLGKTVGPRLLIVIIIAVGVLVFGTGGYVLIEGWSILDAFFMTIITMSTIGYGEVNILSDSGRLFTIVLIIVGVVVASYVVTTVVELFTSQEFLEQVRYRRRHRELEKICDHTIICGFGRLGRNLAKELSFRRCPSIVIDLNPEAVEACRQLGFPVVHGNAADERILEEAGINRAKSLVAAADSDAENVFIVLSAKSMNAGLEIISRCNSEQSIPKLEMAGVKTVISPHAIAGRRAAQLLTHPNVMNFLDGVLEFGDQQMRLEEFIINQESPLAGQTLREARLKVAVLAVTHPDQPLLSHPNADTRLLPGAGIIVMGVEQELNELAEIVKG
jgi:voltage-gated potassium channel